MQLKTYLKRAKLNASEFARRIDVTRECVRLWLDGKAVPQRRHMRRIMELTEGRVKPNDFFPGDAG